MTDSFQVRLNQFQSKDGCQYWKWSCLCLDQLLAGDSFQDCVAGGCKHYCQNADPSVWVLHWNSEDLI